MIGKTISHYRILSQIGEGGMGVVYVAEDVLLGRRVAIKIPHAGRDERGYRARFLREARAVSALAHKNIAAIYDLGETEEGQPYIVMELVSGQTLGDILTGTGLSLARAVEIAREVAEALSEAHRRGIIHRDVKPSNVIINDRGEVKVLDFGLAKQLSEAHGDASTPGYENPPSTATRSDVVIGTPLYLSPEQARGAQVDGRSDLFALGALLYESITGRPAFSGANVIEIGAQVLHFDPSAPSRFNPRVPAELDRLTLKALAKKPEERFQTADEFAAELARVRARLSENDTSRTRRLTTAENLVRSSALNTVAEELRRKRFSPLTLAGALVALLLVVWAVAYWRRPTLHKPAPAAHALYERGVDAMREGAYFKASELLKQSVEVDERFALAHARLAEAWVEMDYLDRAREQMLTATSLVPNLAALPREDALYFEAVRFTVGRKHPEAIKKYEELARLKPEQPQAHFDLGRAYDKNNDTEKAVASYTEATSRNASYAAAFLSLGIAHARRKNLPGAADAFERAEKLYAGAGNREGEAEVHFQRGRLAYEQRRKDDALRELEHALALARASNNLYQQVNAMLQLSYLKEGMDDEGPALVRSAIELAQASGMDNLVARGYITLSNLYLLRNQNDEVERHLMHALELARRSKMRRIEALALFTLGSLRGQQNRPDESLRLVEQARDFYQQGGFRKEAAQAAMLIARSKRDQGDYAGALAALEEQLRLAEQAGDLQLVGSFHQESASVLLRQERLVEAVARYKDALSAARALRDDMLASYCLLNLSGVLWRLGRYDEATATLAQLKEIVGKPDKPNKEMLARALAAEAGMEISRRRFPEAKAKGKQALTLLASLGGRKDVSVDIGAVLCLAEAFDGATARARALCDEAARVAVEVGDPALVSYAQLALAEALLEAGDAKGARAAALRAEEFFARSGRVESNWRALALVGKASRRAGDETAAREYLARAAALLSQFEQSLGADATAYLARLDVQRLRSVLSDSPVASIR